VIKSQLLCQLSYAPTVDTWCVGQFVIVAFLASTVIAAHPLRSKFNMFCKAETHRAGIQPSLADAGRLLFRGDGPTGLSTACPADALRMLPSTLHFMFRNSASTVHLLQVFFCT